MRVISRGLDALAEGALEGWSAGGMGGRGESHLSAHALMGRVLVFRAVNAELANRIAERIRREGPVPFDRYMDAALYEPDLGFFMHGGGAGRSEGDFITSPEVGSLFGAVVARALDQWWEALGRPDPYVVVDAGAGRGQLARDVLRVGPACATALRYVMVERSPGLRALQHEYLAIEPPEDVLGPAVRHGRDDEPEPVPGTGPIVTQTETFPAVRFTGVVVANELLDNLPFRLVERSSDGWHEVRVGIDERGGFRDILVPAESELAAEAEGLLPGAQPGQRIPIQTGVAAWLAECGAMLRRGYVAVIDYADDCAGLARRGTDSWLRTYRGHARGGAPLEAPGSQDVTCDVVLETLHAAAHREGFEILEQRSQAEWLSCLGIDDLVQEGRRVWTERAHLGDLEALKGRSRITESEALLHPAGLGAHLVVILGRGC